MRLEGKVALITGSASALQGELMGFGGAAAWLFVREGAKVALSDINDEVGHRAVSELADSGADAIYLHLDVTSEAQWKEAVQATISAFGRLDILVNNAGTGATQTVEETTEDVWDEQMAVHAKGTLLGYLSDFFGEKLAEIRAPFAGMVNYVVATPPVRKGEPLAMVSHIQKEN